MREGRSALPRHTYPTLHTRLKKRIQKNEEKESLFGVLDMPLKRHSGAI